MNNKQSYKIEVHEDTAKIFYDHVRFLANVSIPAARRLHIKLSAAFDSLKENPERCARYELKKAKAQYHRLITGRYSIIFSIDKQASTVFIRYILDTRQNIDS